MLKKILVLLFSIVLAACSSVKVIDLDKDKIDQKSYASAYEATVATYKGRVNENFYVDNFASGANDCDVYAYYSGVLHAEALQNNFNRLAPNCWNKLDSPSVTQGIYDAMRDLKNGEERDENDEYMVKGSDELLKACSAK